MVKFSHLCEGILPHDHYGAVIDHCFQDDDGKLWVGNLEYGSQVNFCPYCGYVAPVQLCPDLDTVMVGNRKFHQWH